MATRFVGWSAPACGPRARLASEAELILFDEPLGASDALTRLEMQNLIERLWLESRFTAVLVTHDVEEAVALADRVLVMEGGNLIFETAVDLDRPPRSVRVIVYRPEGSGTRAVMKGG